MEAGNKKAANLTTFMLTQDFLPEHWDWEPTELGALGSCRTTAEVILSRLKNAGLKVTEAYAIEHDKDEHELWNEYENQYQVKNAAKHIHFVCKLATGETLENIAKIIGILPNFIAKPKTGRYSYDNMLSYLIHIKYPSKYQYEPNDVITVAGKEYIKYFNESHRRWMHGRAVRIIKEVEYGLKDVLALIMEGKIGKNDLLNDSRYEYIYIMHMGKIDKVLNNKLKFEKGKELAKYAKEREEQRKNRQNPTAN